METKIKQVFTMHKQSTLEGLRQLLCEDPNEIKTVVDRLVEEGYLTTGTATWNGCEWTVYKKAKQKQATLFE